jgi:dTMP kinase
MKDSTILGVYIMIVVLEGIDNCGKTTTSEQLSQYFKRTGRSVHISKELTTDVGSLIKNASSTSPFSPIMKTFLFAADRQLRLEEIEKSNKYDVYIFDRYLYSAIAYREAEGIDRHWVQEINRCIPPFDIGFYIDISPEESIRRNTDAKFNIHYSLEYLSHVRESYLREVKDGNLIMIDGMCNNEKVYQQIIDTLSKRGY